MMFTQCVLYKTDATQQNKLTLIIKYFINNNEYNDRGELEN